MKIIKALNSALAVHCHVPYSSPWLTSIFLWGQRLEVTTNSSCSWLQIKLRIRKKILPIQDRTSLQFYWLAYWNILQAGRDWANVPKNTTDTMKVKYILWSHSKTYWIVIATDTISECEEVPRWGATLHQHGPLSTEVPVAQTPKYMVVRDPCKSRSPAAVAVEVLISNFKSSASFNIAFPTLLWRVIILITLFTLILISLKSLEYLSPSLHHFELLLAIHNQTLSLHNAA